MLGILVHGRRARVLQRRPLLELDVRHLLASVVFRDRLCPLGCQLDACFVRQVFAGLGGPLCLL